MNKHLNIVIICGADPFSGPGIIALDMLKSFERDSHDVTIITNSHINLKRHNIVSINKNNRVKKQHVKYSPANVFIYLLSFFKKHKTSSKYNMYSLENQNSNKNSKLVLNVLNKIPDVFIFMFSHNFITTTDLKYLYNLTHVPLLFWLMDAAAMTGGCHFTWECKGYTSYCGNCPGINSKNKKDLTNKNMLQKKEIFDQIELYPLYGGEKIRQMLLESSLFKNKSICKANVPVDKDFYTNNLKKETNHSNKEKIIFIAANKLTSERKGLKILLKSLKELATQLNYEEHKNILLAIAGNNIDEIKKDIPFNYKHLGYLSHDAFAKAMRNAHFFICPSIEDYGPMVINQSLMSGVPVVAFNMGVASDIVQTGITGYRASLGDEEDLKKGIKYMLDLDYPTWQKMSDNCRKLALKDFSVDKIRDDFYNIFNNILNK